MASRAQIEKFLASPSFGVVGASADRAKYGNKVLRRYLQHGLKAIPIHPKESQIEGQAVLASVAQLPPETHSISVITSPAVTERIVDQAISKGIQNIWMQPGAESAAAVRKAEAAGINVIADGSCILVELG